MSRTIDEKVVSLQFENQNFEKNVKTSMSTLEKFQNSLKFDGAEKGIEKVEKVASKFDMKHMTEEVTNTSKAFSALETVATGVLLRIGSKIGDVTTKLVTSLSGIENVTNGYSKFEQKTGSVQTLLNSTGKDLEDINKYLNTLMRFSDETSYGFTEMASSLAQLTSNGGDIERLVPMITGIANAVAFAGKGPAEFSRAIYNLNQSYGAGALKYLDWKSLEQAGVASKDLKKAFIETAIELGKLNEEAMTTSGTIVDIANFSQTLKDNWADTEVMEETFGKFAKYTQMADEMVNSGEVETYYEAYEILAQTYDDVYLKAAKAAQETKTFNEAVEATKDAVSSVWLTFFETVFGDFYKAKTLWSSLAEDLYDIFVVPGKKMNEVVGGAFKDVYTQLEDVFKGKAFKDAGVTFENFSESFMAFLKNSGYNIDELIEKYGSLRDAFAEGDAIITDAQGHTARLGDVFSRFLTKFVADVDAGRSATKDIAGNLEKVQNIFDGIWRGDFGNGAERVEKLTKASIDYATAQDLINRLAKEGHRSGYILTAKDIEYLSEAELKNLGITPELANEISKLAKEADKANQPLSELIGDIVGRSNRKTAANLLAETILNLTGTIKNLQSTVGEAWSKVFTGNLADVIYNIMLRIHDFVEAIREATTESKLLTDIFTIFFHGLKIIGKGFTLVYEVVKKLIEAGIKVLSTLFKDLNINVDDFATTISDALDMAIDWVKNNETIIEYVEKAANGLSSALSAVKSWIEQVVSLDDVSLFFSGIKDSLTNLSNVKIDFSGLLGGYSKVVEKIKTGKKLSFKDITSGIAGFFTNFKDTVTKALSDTYNQFKMSEDQIAEFEDKIQKFGESLVTLGFGYLSLTTFKKLAESLSDLISPIRTLSDVFASFADVGKSIKAYIDTMTKDRAVNNILKVSVAVGIFAAALYALASIGDSDALWTAIKATAALFTIIGVFIGVMTLLGKVNTKDGSTIQVNLTNFAVLIGALAGSLLLVAAALKVIDGVKTQTLFLGGAILITLMGVLTACANSIKDGSKFYRAGSSIKDIIGFAVGIYLLAMALKKFDEVEFKHPIWTLTYIAAFAAALFAVGVALKHVSGWSSLPIIAFTLSIVKILETIKKLSDVKGSTYAKGLLRLIPIFAVIITIMKLSKGLAKEGATFSAMFIVGIATSLLLVGKAIEQLASLDEGQLIKGGGAALALFTAIGLIGAVMTRIANIEKGSIKSAIGAAIIIVTAAASLYVMAGAILLYKNIPEEDLWKAVKAIGEMFAAIGFLFVLIGASGLFYGGDKSKNASQAYQVVSALGKIAIIVGILAVSLAGLALVAHFDPTAFNAAIIGIVSVIGSLAILVVALSVIKSFKDLSVQLGAVIGILASVGTVLYVLSTQIPDSEKAIAVAKSLSEIMLAVSAAILVTSIAAKLCSGLTNAGAIIVSLGEILGIIMALAAVIAVIDEFVDDNGHISSAIDTFVNVMTKIGEAIGGFAGGALGGLVSGFTNELVQAGANISAFADSIKSIFELQVPETFSDTLNNIRSVFAVFGGNKEYIKNIASLKEDTGNIKTFFTQFGGALKIFSDSVEEIDIEKVNAASNAGNMFAALSETLGKTRTGGLMSLIFGGKENLGSFSSNMVTFGKGLVNFSNEVKSFDAAKIENILPVIKEIIGLESNLQSNGSLLGLLIGGDKFGNKSLDDFAERVTAFGAGLKAFSLSLVGFNPKSVDIAVKAGETLTELEKSLQISWNIMGFFEGGDDGNRSLSDFGNRIQEFVAGLVNGLNALSQLNVSNDIIRKPLAPLSDGETGFDTVNKAVDELILIGEKFSAFEGTLNESGSLFSDNGSLAKFGTGIATLGTGIKNFSDTFPDNLPEIEDVKQMITITQMLLDFSKANTLTQEESENMTTLGDSIQGVTGRIGDLFGKVTGLFSGEGMEFDPEMVKDNLSSIFDNDTVTEGISESGTNVTKTLLDSMGGTILSSESRTKLDTNVKNLGETTVKKLDKKKEMTSNAVNYMQGLINGLESMKAALFAKVDEIAAGVTSRMQFKWSMHSPSKVAYKLGAYYVEGLINGFADMTEPAVETAESMALSVVDAVSAAMDTSTQVLEDTYSPMITPVLDTESFMNSASSINGFLDSYGNYSALLGVNAAREGMQNQNGGQNPVEVTVNFTVNNAGKDLTEADITTYARRISNEINTLLGNAI